MTVESFVVACFVGLSSTGDGEGGGDKGRGGVWGWGGTSMPSDQTPPPRELRTDLSALTALAPLGLVATVLPKR